MVALFFIFSDDDEDEMNENFDIRFVNNCNFDIWIENSSTLQEGSMTNPNFVVGGPVPGTQKVTKVLQGDNFDVIFPRTGIAGTRFWGKFDCDETGTNCAIGDSQQYWCNPDNPSEQNPNAVCPPGEKGLVGGCPATGCTPPIDSLFEATTGCKFVDTSRCWRNPADASQPLSNMVTNFNTSQVDGWTFPYKLEILGRSSECDNGNGLEVVDGSRLSPSICPSMENMSLGGMFPTTEDDIGLTSVDLTFRDNDGRLVGCMSPCQKISGGMPAGFNQPLSPGGSEPSVPAAYMCCPDSLTNVEGASSMNLPDACTNGPTWCDGCGVAQSDYVEVVRNNTNNNVYSYAFDDSNGLHTCPSVGTKYVMTFCPVGSSEYPG